VSWIKKSALHGWLRAASRALRATTPNLSRVALLVDADNISGKIAAPMLHDVSSLGRLSAGRVYANFAGSKMDSWAGLVRDWNLRPVHGYRVTPSKNATDIALVVDAMDLLRDGAIDVFVLVTDDADLTPLVRRIQEQGLPVCGYGTRRAAPALQRACNRFVILEHLQHTPVQSGSPTPLWKRRLWEAEEKVVAAVLRLGREDEAVSLSALGQHLTERSRFDPRAYGCRTLKELVAELELVELIHQDDVPMVRLRSGTAAGSEAN
jgi:uncharacterized protein (TIGR00288 family)